MMDEKQFIDILLRKLVDVAEARGRTIECNLTITRQNQELRKVCEALQEDKPDE